MTPEVWKTAILMGGIVLVVLIIVSAIVFYYGWVDRWNGRKS